VFNLEGAKFRLNKGEQKKNKTKSQPTKRGLWYFKLIICHLYLGIFSRPTRYHLQLRDEWECLFQSHSLPFPMVYSHSHSRTQQTSFSLVLFTFPSHSYWSFPFPPAPIPELLVVSHRITKYGALQIVICIVLYCINDD